MLLGDPQQLEQPQKGSHPDGVDVSALEHVLGGAQTMPDDRGIFLPVTWRLAPAICRFTSEVFYEGRLDVAARARASALAGSGAFDEPGLCWVPVEHDRNQNCLAEEVDVVDAIVTALLVPARTWIDTSIASNDALDAGRHPGRGALQRAGEPAGRIVSRRAGCCVGTVDKFQGQEAPVVIYSMATSRPEDAPRGMEFLYSLNRLNVATSRARCAVAILVASPHLFEPECRTPRQMQLANALCRYRELARIVSL